jgi:pentatricopeptide repeat domain-containing protein 1
MSTKTPSSTTTTTTNISLSSSELEKTIVQLGRTGKTDLALNVYHDAKDNHGRNVRILNAALDACARSQPTRLQQAFDLLETSQATPNVFTFGALMNACNRAGNAKQAMQLLREMPDKYRIEPNAVVYSAAISACARASKNNHTQYKDMALNLLKEAVEEKQLQMSVVGFNAAVSACAQCGDYRNAISILQRMQEARQKFHDSTDDTVTTPPPLFSVPEPDAVTYGTILAACENAHQWKMVLQYAQEMESKHMRLDGLAIMSCLHACAEMGYSQHALQYLEQLKRLRQQPARKSQTHRERPPLQGPDAVAYHVAIAACARGGAWQEGIRLLEESKTTVGRDAANVVAYTAAITGCEYAGEWKHAFRLLDAMRKEGVAPNELTMGAVIGACAKAVARQYSQDEYDFYSVNRNDDDDDDVPLAFQKGMQLLKVLKRDASVVDPNIQIYNAAIRLCAEARQVDAAFALMREIRENPALEATEITYGSLMTACERVGDVEGASRVFRMMKEHDSDRVRPNEIIYGAAISCCRKAKEPQRAFLLLKRMIQEGLSPNAACLNTVLIAQTERVTAKKNRRPEDSETVLTVFKLMRSPRYIDEGGRPNRQTYNILVNYFCATDRPATAEAFLSKMQSDGGFKPDVDLFTSTVSAYERTQQPLKAVRLLQKMQEEGFDFYSVKVLNNAFGKAVKVWNAVGRNFQGDGEDMVEAERRSLEQFIEDCNDMQGNVTDVDGA